MESCCSKGSPDCWDGDCCAGDDLCGIPAEISVLIPAKAGNIYMITPRKREVTSTPSIYTWESIVHGD